MNKIKIIVWAWVFILPASAQSNQWGFDPAHTKIAFSISHMMISDVPGQFDAFDGTIQTDNDDFSSAKVNFTIDVNSINTHNVKRDNHLRSPDFFNTEMYPNITFVSTKIKPSLKKNEYTLIGDLTMNGITKTVKLKTVHRGTIKDPYGNIRAGFKVTGVLNRTEWGLKYNSVMDTGGLLIGEEVDIVCDVELIRQ